MASGVVLDNTSCYLRRSGLEHMSSGGKELSSCYTRGGSSVSSSPFSKLFFFIRKKLSHYIDNAVLQRLWSSRRSRRGKVVWAFGCINMQAGHACPDTTCLYLYSFASPWQPRNVKRSISENIIKSALATSYPCLSSIAESANRGWKYTLPKRKKKVTYDKVVTESLLP